MIYCYRPSPSGAGVDIKNEHVFDKVTKRCIYCDASLKEAVKDVKPPKREASADMQFEKVTVEDFVTGVIDDIQYEMEHEFKFKGEVKKKPGCRFKFKLEGYEHAHYSQWLTFSYGELTNLYKIYLSSLVDDATPDMDFELDTLKGMKVKILWKESKNGFQFPGTIRRLRGADETYTEQTEEDCPF